MPVSEISKGVFIVAPRELPKYKDTAAGEYTSVFTKQRANQWEMAQKQALLNMDLGAKRYAEEMKTYRDRLDALDARQKELESLKVRVAEGQLKAEDAAAIAAAGEATARQRTAAGFKAQGAELLIVNPGSTTTVTGGGGGAGTVGAPISSGAQTAAVTFEQTTRGQTLDAKMQAMARETGTGGTIPTTGAADRVNARGSIADRAIASRSAELEKAGQSPANARLAAEREALTALSATDPVAAREVSDYLSSKAAPAAGGGGGGPTTRVTTRPADITTLKRPELGDLPDAPDVARSEVADRQPVIQDINEFINNLEMAKLGIPRPTLGGSDFITDSRDIMRGRFGGFGGAADALPYEQRNVVDRLLKDPAYGLSGIEGYRDYLAKQRSEADTAARLRESMAEGPANTSVEALRGAPLLQADQAAAQTELTRAAGQDLLQSRRPSMFDGLVAPAVPQIPERGAINIPRRTALTEPPATVSVPTDVVAPVEPPSPAQSVPEAVSVAPVALRPEAAALMTPAEIAEFKARLQEFADAAQIRRELAAIDTGGSEINPAFRTPLLPPPIPPRPVLPTMSVPQQVAAPFDMQFAVPRTPVPPPPPLGAKEEGPLVVASPAMAPSTSGAAPRGPADVSAAVRPAGPLSGKLPYQIKAENERFAKSVEMADDVRVATKTGLGVVGSQYGIKKGGPPSTVGYFQNRAEVALELKDKRGKLDRIASSGPGKVAKDLWSQNSKSGKPFENTWQEIQMTFAGDQKSLEVAHEVALAYDIIAREDKAPLKQSPK